MNSGGIDQMINILTYVLIGLVVLVIILGIMYFIMSLKGNSDNAPTKQKNNNRKEKTDTKTTNTAVMGKKSIFDFMEFDKIEDNMIIKKENSRYLMIIECQGINYDLMSEVEKTGVEEGFVQFLNTLRHPIQIYIQTRMVNLESSLNAYKSKVREVEAKLQRMQLDYQEMSNSGNYTKEELGKALFEITKQRNLYEYGIDIISDTEKMSLNRNISTKKYYIVVSYFASELGNHEFDTEEVKNIAFSELYTRAQSIIRTLSVCNVVGKILNSNELMELMYMAYNREEAEVFRLDKALRAGYDDLYSTAPDVLDKKMEALDNEIEKQAAEKAKNKVEEVRSRKAIAVEEKEQSFEDLVDEMAALILEDNKQYVGEEVAEEAKKEIEKERKAKKRKGEK